MHTALAILLSAATFNPGDPEWGFWLNLIAIALSIIGPPSLIPLILHLSTRPRKQLSYQAESDAALIDRTKDAGDDFKVLFQGGMIAVPTEVNDIRLIMFKISNTGSEMIKKEDFRLSGEERLRFEFPSANLILCAIHHTEPEYLILKEDRKHMIHLDPSVQNAPPVQNTSVLPTGIILPPTYAPPRHSSPLAKIEDLSFHKYVDLDGLDLERGNAVILKFVTRGKAKMKGPQGSLLGGKIVPYTPPVPVFTVPRILIGLLVAILIVASITVFGTFRQNDCVLSLSPVNIGGSSAFYPTAQAEANAYHQGCPFVTLNVQSNDSGAGLLKLEQQNLDISASEISLQEAGYKYRDLLEHPIAVIVFTIILNKSVTGITSLSQNQITGIYDGQYTNWDQLPGLHGPDLPIVLFNRPSDSGTQASFSRFVLEKPGTAPQTTLSTTQEMISDVSSQQGAIGYVDLGSADQANNAVTSIAIDGNAPTPGLVESGAYPFWAIERLYTRQDNANPLVSAFITYVINNIQTNTTFIKRGDMPQGVLATHE